MKNSKQIFVTCLAVGVFSLALSLPFISMKREKSSAYTASSLPTTIDLNDTSESNIRSYYSSLNNLSTSERQGTNLLKNLKTVLKNGQKYYSYENGTSIWQMYEITDRDWEKSPASSTTYGTYNSSTNKINNYTYGTSSSSSKNNPYIHALYINRNVNNQTTAWDNHNQDEWGINREHVWPKAEGFDSNGAGGARGDPMHLMAGNGYSNNIHSNYYYGYVKTSTTYTDCGSKYSNQYGNLRGTSKTLNTGTVFEPQDSDKGDIARAIFYMVARYNYLSGSDSDGIDTNNPNLTLTQSISDWSSTGYTSSTTTQGKLGVLSDLLAWHHADPVDEYEIHRNNLLYTNFTNNRNPFIDFPEWVDYIWGTATYSGTTYQSYNSNPTGYAKPSSDTINGYNSGGQGGDTPTVNSVTVSPASLNLDLNGTTTGDLTATVDVSNGAATTVSWTSSNTDVATVNSDGTVTAVSVGNAIVTATSTVDGSKYGSCSVIVEDSSQSGGSDTSNGSVTAASGALEGWTASGTGNAYADGSVKFDSSGDNVYCLTLFTGVASTNMTSLTVTINGKINGSPTDANSYKVEALDSQGNALDSDVKTGASVVTTSYGDTVFTMDSNLSGCRGIKITYVTKGGGNWGIKSVSWAATYSNQTEPTSIIATANKTFHVGDTITKSDITVEDDLGNVINDYTFSNYQFTYEDAVSGGAQTIHDFDIEYGGFETTLEVSVSREAYAFSEEDLIYNGSDFSSIGDTYGTGKTAIVNYITFAIDGYCYSDSKLSFSNGKTSAPGSLVNSTAYPRGITNVTVTGASPDIQLSVDGNNWVDLSNATPSTVDYFYFKLFYKNTSQSSYVNITQFSVTLKESPSNLANYIMYTDTDNQCVTKLDDAIIFFGNMTTSGRNTFMTSSDYVLVQARTRLEAWMINQGKSIDYINGDYVVNSANHMQLLSLNKDSNNAIIIICIIISFTMLLSFIYFGSKKFKRIYK